MPHQNGSVFSVFHCAEGAFGAASGGTQKMKNGAPRDELQNGRGCVWVVPDFLQDGLGLYFSIIFEAQPI